MRQGVRSALRRARSTSGRRCREVAPAFFMGSRVSAAGGRKGSARRFAQSLEVGPRPPAGAGRWRALARAWVARPPPEGAPSGARRCRRSSVGAWPGHQTQTVQAAGAARTGTAGALNTARSFDAMQAEVSPCTAPASVLRSERVKGPLRRCAPLTRSPAGRGHGPEQPAAKREVVRVRARSQNAPLRKKPLPPGSASSSSARKPLRRLAKMLLPTADGRRGKSFTHMWMEIQSAPLTLMDSFVSATECETQWRTDWERLRVLWPRGCHCQVH